MIVGIFFDGQPGKRIWGKTLKRCSNQDVVRFAAEGTLYGDEQASKRCKRRLAQDLMSSAKMVFWIVNVKICTVGKILAARFAL
jgi:hypothetical protein